jgi:adenosine deaminase
VTISDAALRALPKAELHLHLEGAVAAETLADLARKHGQALDVDDPRELYRFTDLGSFLQMYGRVCDAVRDADDFRRMTYEALARVARSGGRYAEVFFSPAAHAGVDYAVMLDGIGAGVRDAATDFGIRANVIPAHDRERGPDAGVAFVAMVLAHPRPYVIGIGLDYMENDPRPFAAMYAQARAGGLHVSAHAGEVGPAAHVRDSLDVLRCERIDHGYYVVDDPALMARCREAGTPFTACPTTTTYTTAWRDLDAPDHAIRRMLASGLALTINSDDPGLMRTTLFDEYRILVDRFGASPAVVRDVCLNGARSAWLPADERAALVAAWSAEIDRHIDGPAVAAPC